MNWAIIAQLIIQEGLPLAEKIWQKWSTGSAPSQADWDELKALSLRTPETQMQDALTRAGFSLDDPKAKELLALVKNGPISTSG